MIHLSKTGGFPQLCYSGFPEATVSTLSMHGGFADFPAGERGAQQVPANGGLLSHQGAQKRPFLSLPKWETDWCFAVGNEDFRIGGFLKWGFPQIIHFNRIFHYKPSIFRYHHLWKPPYALCLDGFEEIVATDGNCVFGCCHLRYTLPS